MVDYFRKEKVNEKITAIRSRSGEIMYLVEGSEKAVLIDTCLGIKGLRSFVEALTDKPVTVILTHGHVDHAMGAPEFDKVYMNSADNDLYARHSALEARKGYIEANIGGFEEWLSDDDSFVAPKTADYYELKDKMVFSLGDISIEVYELPGHTLGTMVALIPEERILITGDACNTATFLFDDSSLCVEEYHENLKELSRKLDGKFDKIYMMHHVMAASAALIKNVIEVCEDIMAGKADDMEFQFMGQTYYTARYANEQFIRADAREGNIIYNKRKIYKKGKRLNELFGN